MAKHDGLLDQAEKVKLLKAFAFQVHRKRSLEDVVMEHVELELQRGRRREYRPVAEAINAEGPAAAMRAMDLVGDEAAAILKVIAEEGKDHRLLSDILERLADLQSEAA
ncbi:MAG TPA: hypothetical protein VM661_03315 [Candidatus Sulfotelmatobacter sp.]|jgi:hypothetical protein|nr:hypothetical protein [Candidatus Sulfotelmatobacter sp.]